MFDIFYRFFILIVACIVFVAGPIKGNASCMQNDTTKTINSLDSLSISADSTLKQQNADSVSLVNADSLLTVQKDSVTQDSMKHPSSFISDTLTVKGGVLPYMKEKFFNDQARLASSFDTLPNGKIKYKRNLKDTISADTAKGMTFGRLTALSLVAPGFGQIYNKQYWKIPVLYASTGTFLALTIRASKQFSDYRDRYLDGVKTGLPADELNGLMRDRNKFNTQKSIFMVATAVSYLYFVGDAAINYKGEVHPTRKATILSAIFPGAGQVYNKSYWKLPIIYGGMATFGYIIDFNNRGYQRFKTAVIALTDDDPNTVDEFNGQYTATYLQNTRDSYRRYRDLGLILMAGFYVLNIVDAHVQAYLNRYDISDNLALRIEPAYTPRNNLSGRRSSDSFGLAMRLNF